MLILSIWSYIQKPTILILNRNSKYNLKTHTRSPNSAINLDNTWGSFSRRKVMTSDPSNILLLISRKILSTLSDTGSIKQNKKNKWTAAHPQNMGYKSPIHRKVIHTRVFLHRQPGNARFFQHCSSIPELHMPCIHPYKFYSKDPLVYLCSPKPNPLPIKSGKAYKYKT